jgi:hypothetical protein
MPLKHVWFFDEKRYKDQRVTLLVPIVAVILVVEYSIDSFQPTVAPLD